MILTRGLGRVPVYRYQPETLQYRADVLYGGGTIAERSLQHVDKFVRDCKEAGVWSKLIEVATFTGDQLAAACTKVKHSDVQSISSFNFVEGDYSEATGLTGNGTTKYLDLNFAPAVVGITGHLAFYQRTDNAAGGTRMCVGACDATDDYWLGSLNPPAQSDARFGKSTTASGGGQMVKGFYYAERVSGTDLKVYRNNAQIGSSTGATSPAAPVYTFHAWARNNVGVAAGFSGVTGSFLSAGLPLSAQERAEYYAIVQTLQANLGRGV